MKNPKGCWRMCAAVALAQFCAMGLNANAFSVFIPYLTEALSLTYNQCSGFLMIRNLVSVGAVYIAKYYYEKLDIRLGFTLVLIINIVSLYLCANANTYSVLCMSMAISGVCYGLGGVYPVALLIHRWFQTHESLAMGVCAASTGLAITVGAPIFTALIENHSMKFTMYCEMAFFALCLIICYIIIRNYPEGATVIPTRADSKRQRIKFTWMIPAVIALGMFGSGFSYLSSLYADEGLDPFQVSYVISIIGFVLTGSKFLLGELIDLWGAYRINWIYLSLAIVACLLFSFGASLGFTAVIIAAVVYGIGNAISTVGVATFARDLSKPEDYATTQQMYQIAFLLGGLLCTFIAGPIATVANSYRLFYAFITVLVALAMIIIQSTYRKAKITH